ncbi:hypothetical protein DAPPUDRAFT_236728 [Daphnia pulex]|uniref:Uncharacterized protein n=1 Tax=Daphnia pulex TaxID=6669 RepID=E9G2Y7_DAPPU|nr:hypothetical protein DAPPUDRAFT_236728 [Daphnia pulex]|eukprot:EFX86422.1 hypothetical protein DAPPUDRAFT_236728 [Daphnia pulex]
MAAGRCVLNSIPGAGATTTAAAVVVKTAPHLDFQYSKRTNNNALKNNSTGLITELVQTAYKPSEVMGVPPKWMRNAIWTGGEKKEAAARSDCRTETDANAQPTDAVEPQRRAATLFAPAPK